MNILDFQSKKNTGEKISLITCYDYPSAKLIASTSIDAVLVGDSVAMVVHGHASTITADLDMMVIHTKAVAKGLGNQFLISDLPFLAHRQGAAYTFANVKQLLQAGAQAIKIEGGDEETCQTITHLVNAGIPVMGHIGLTPQFIHQFGGFKIQGKTSEQTECLINQALRLQQSGCFSIVIECVPGTVAKLITEKLNIPTIGIGAGINTNGQILVWHDVLGLQTEFKPRFVKRFTEGSEWIKCALNQYAQEVQTADFPCHEHTF